MDFGTTCIKINRISMYRTGNFVSGETCFFQWFICNDSSVAVRMMFGYSWETCFPNRYIYGIISVSLLECASSQGILSMRSQQAVVKSSNLNVLFKNMAEISLIILVLLNLKWHLNCANRMTSVRRVIANFVF